MSITEFLNRKDKLSILGKNTTGKIRDFNSDYDKKTSEGQIVNSVYSLDYNRYARKLIISKNVPVTIDSIVGTKHGDYANSSWAQVNLKREENLEYFLNNPSKYFETHPEDFDLVQVNSGDYYVNGSGNHRMIILKCAYDMVRANLFPDFGFNGILNADSVCEYSVDYEFRDEEQNLRQFMGLNNIHGRVIFQSNGEISSTTPREFWLNSEIPKFEYDRIACVREIKALRYCLEKEIISRK